MVVDDNWDVDALANWANLIFPKLNPFNLGYFSYLLNVIGTEEIAYHPQLGDIKDDSTS